ncbi:hypothetical protein [Actinotalea sp.]|uniref:hypothetical protein n=1 Tax=Actinotalea sp. TaxID=1872145 RepID=UPI0035651049
MTVDASQAAALLGLAAAYDNRAVSEAAARAWALALPDVRFEDAQHAVAAHYRTTRVWIMPADVLAGVRRLRSDRLMAAGADLARLDPPASADGMAWLSGVHRRVADGFSVSDASAATPMPRLLTDGDDAA